VEGPFKKELMKKWRQCRQNPQNTQSSLPYLWNARSKAQIKELRKNFQFLGVQAGKLDQGKTRFEK